MKVRKAIKVITYFVVNNTSCQLPLNSIFSNFRQPNSQLSPVKHQNIKETKIIKMYKWRKILQPTAGICVWPNVALYYKSVCAIEEQYVVTNFPFSLLYFRVMKN